MKIEFLPTHSLNLGEDVEYIAAFIKGKAKPKTENIRILVKGLKTGDEYLLMLEGRENFFGRKISYTISPIPVNDYNYKTIDLIKIRYFNYYRLDSDPSHVHDFFSLWKSSDPMIHTGNLRHQFLSTIKGYKGSYRFDNITY
jgi:hypothetical protein